MFPGFSPVHNYTYTHFFFSLCHFSHFLVCYPLFCFVFLFLVFPPSNQLEFQRLFILLHPLPDNFPLCCITFDHISCGTEEETRLLIQELSSEPGRFSGNRCLQNLFGWRWRCWAEKSRHFLMTCLSLIRGFNWFHVFFSQSPEI